MNYLLMIYENEKETARFPKEKMQEIFGGYNTFTQKAKEQGILEDSKGLLPTSNATTVRVRNGKIALTDGPFAETPEQICGYYLISCKDLDEAVEVAGRIPSAAYGSVEIRPIRTF